MHYVSKGLRKSITLGFPLVYCGTFIVHKWKKYHLNLPSRLYLAPINIEWKLVPLESVLSDMPLNSLKEEW